MGECVAERVAECVGVWVSVWVSLYPSWPLCREAQNRKNKANGNEDHTQMN